MQPSLSPLAGGARPPGGRGVGGKKVFPLFATLGHLKIVGCLAMAAIAYNWLIIESCGISFPFVTTHNLDLAREIATLSKLASSEDSVGLLSTILII